MLADEPTASLDKQSGRDVVKLIEDLAREDGSAVILVTHDNRILDVADRILHLEDGRMKSLSEVVSEGTCRMLNLLEKHDPQSANYLATFSFALARVAYADNEVSDSAEHFLNSLYAIAEADGITTSEELEEISTIVAEFGLAGDTRPPTG